MPKRALLPVLVLCLWTCLLPAPARPEEGAPLSGGPEVTELTEQGRSAIVRGLAWLASKQEPNGSWKANVGYKLNDGYVVQHDGVSHVGVTALAGMAFLAAGHVPGRGKYGAQVEGAIRYILSCVNRQDGMIADNDSRMYSHAFATLFLAEVYGMTRDSSVKTALERATEFTWKCQNSTGGWRYVPFAADSDMSITVCQVMALRSARNIGIRIPKETIDRAVNYVLMSAHTDPFDDPGSFDYQWRSENPIATRTSFALTAAGLATLYSAGLYTDEDILKHIRAHRIDRFLRGDAPPRIEMILRELRNTYRTTQTRHYFFYYGNYYAVQAMFVAGGKAWEEYFSRVQSDLVDLQQPDGHWPIDVPVGTAYATASACLILSIPYRYLPIFQR
jgi:hypothetical protein